MILYIPTMDRELVGSTTLGGRRDVSRLVFRRDGLGMTGSFWRSERCGGTVGGRGMAAEALRAWGIREGVRRISRTEGWVMPIILRVERRRMERVRVREVCSSIRVSCRLLWSMGMVIYCTFYTECLLHICGQRMDAQ